MRQVLRILAVVLGALGIFWVGRESAHGLSALWEHWWCPTPLVLVLIAAIVGLAARRSPSAA